MRYSVKRCRNNGRIRRNVPTFCHSDRSVSRVEKSTTLLKEPTQGKICNSGRFLDSLLLARNDMPGGGCIQPYGLHSLRTGTAHRPFPTVSLGGCTSAPIVPTMQNAVPRLIHRLWRSPFPEGEGYGRNTIQPHRLYSKRGGRQIAAPTDTLVGHRSSAQVVFDTLLGDESSPLHCVIPFNHTGYIRNVAGGRLPPLQTRWWGTVYPHRFYSKRPWRYTIAPVVCAMFRAVLPTWERILEENCVKYM